MSDHDEVPDLSPEAKQFLERHERTGEPTAAGLARGQRRVAALSQTPAPTQLRRRRPLVPPEVMAAAAVVAIVLGVQVLYLALRAEPVVVVSPPAAPVSVPLEGKVALPRVAEPADLEAKGLIWAWRSGDLEGANRLAVKDCSSETCRGLAADVRRAVDLAQRLDTLSPGELDELGLLDAKLADGSSTSLGRQVAKRQSGSVDGSSPLSPAARAEAEQLYAEARAEHRAKNYERAAIRAEKCIKIAPRYHPCYRMLGSVYASIATRDQSASDMEKARRYYERFLDVAPPDDEYVPKVQAILDQAREKSVREAMPQAQLAIAVGNTEELTLPQDISRLAVGDPSVADISVEGQRTVRVVGVNPGKTTLLVWLSDGARESRLIDVQPARRATPSSLFADAERARAAGDWVRAVELARRVLISEQNHAGALRLLLEARTQSREAYLRGYQLRETDPEEAIKLFKYVVSITADDDEWHQKAESRVAELEPELDDTL